MDKIKIVANRLLGPARKRVAKLRYSGSQLTCSVCSSGVKRFLPLPRYFSEMAAKHGFPYALSEFETLNVENYSCPFCGASDRDRLYALYINEHLAGVALSSPLRILDFAPSAPLSLFIRRKLPSAAYRTADLFRTDVDDQVDITRLNPYGNDSFDFIICSHILEHVEDDQRAVAELYRVLKAGGKMIIMVPIHLRLQATHEDFTQQTEAQRWMSFAQGDHVRLYAKQGFLDLIAGAGFTLHQVGVDDYGIDCFSRHGISPQSVLYVAEKP